MENIEQKVISGLLIDSSSLDELEIANEHFAIRDYRLIFECINELFSNKEHIDFITVADKLPQFNSLLADLAKDSTAYRNIKSYSDLLKKQYTERETQYIAEQLALKEINASEAIKLLSQLEKAETINDYSWKEVLNASINGIEDAFMSEDILRGISTGISALDANIGGFHKSELYIIGARPAMGKTAVMINMILSANTSVGFISAEQPMQQIGDRAFAIGSMINATAIRNGALDEDDFTKLTSAMGKQVNHKIRVCDKPALKITELISIARKWKRDYDIQAIYIDYVQRIKASNGSVPRHEQMAEVAESLKELARELDIAVIALAQVNRAIESQANKRPTMGYLKDSGTIEQEADNVMLLYRDEVYDENSPDKGIMEIIVSKDRHGMTGTIRVAWQGEYLKVSDLAPEYYETH